MILNLIFDNIILLLGAGGFNPKIKMKINKLKAFRKSQLQKALKNGLKEDILKVRGLLKIPDNGFTDEKSAFAWEKDLPLPLPKIILEGRNEATPQEESELDHWLAGALLKRGTVNSTLLTLVIKGLCSKYDFDDEWEEFLKQALLYNKDFHSLKLPSLLSFIKIRDQYTGKSKVIINPSVDAVPSDFESKDFAKAFWTVRKATKIDDVLQRSDLYKVLQKHTGRFKKDPILELIGRQSVWPWMETFHEINGFLQFFYDLDKEKYKSLIASLEKVHWKLAQQVTNRMKHLGQLQENYTNRVKRGEMTPDEAESLYQKNIKALHGDYWSEEDKKTAGRVIARAEREIQRLERHIKRVIKKAVSSVPRRKRLKSVQLAN